MDVDLDVEQALLSERPRLVRWCARLSGSRQAAEDLAQDTLLVAWRSADRLPPPAQIAPWLAGIARNVCRSWVRRHYREQARLIGAYGAATDPLPDPLASLPDDFDLEVELERDELALLLDRALALLPRATGALLVQHYIHESPHAEIAARLGISEGAVGVRLHRGKLALRRVLTAELRAEAAAYGLAAGWNETRIWCPQCGGRRLQGRWESDAAGSLFLLRCPACDGADGIMTAADLTVPAYAQLLGHARAYKPALTRLQTAVTAYFRQAIASGRANCLVCGRAARLWWGTPLDSPRRGAWPELRAWCDTCGWASNCSLASLVMALPAGQRFWRAYPRMRTAPLLEMEAHGVPALLTRLQSTTTSAELAVVSARDTFAVLAIDPTPDS
jgi:RNA polymerase sigma-70 factor (ECF subfamily)